MKQFSRSSAQFGDWFDRGDDPETEIEHSAVEIRRLAQHASGVPLGNVLPSTWTGFLHQYSISQTPNSQPRLRIDWGRIASAAIAVCVVLSLGIGVWQLADETKPPTGKEMEWSALMAATPTGEDGAKAYVPLSEIQHMDVSGLPNDIDPAECVVEPLTVDEVIWYVKDDRSNDKAFADDEIHRLSDSGEWGQAIASDLKKVGAIQRQWMACALAFSLFQRWALESPALVRQTVVDALPPLTSEDDLRAILEDLRVHGWRYVHEVHGAFLRHPISSFIDPDTTQEIVAELILTTDPENTWATDTFISAGYRQAPSPLDEDQSGHVTDASDAGVLWAEDGVTPFKIYPTCETFHFQYNPARETWLVLASPRCG